MKLDLQNVFEGFKNYIFKDEQVESEAIKRLEQCYGCGLRDGGVCSKNKEVDGIKGCGCALKLKARSGSKCPRNKW
jgi:hypothetical protein